MNKLHYDINELEQQYSVLYQTLEQYINQLENKVFELQSFSDDKSSTSISLLAIKEKIDDQAITNLKQMIDVFREIQLKLNYAREYYSEYCGNISLDEEDLLQNIEYVKRTINYYDDIEYSLRLVPELNVIHDVEQIKDKLHELLVMYQQKLDGMYLFEDSIRHLFSNEIEELKIIQANIKDMNSISGYDGLLRLSSLVSNSCNVDDPPVLENFDNYDDYLKAVGQYAYAHGYADRIVYDGNVFYKFKDLNINHDYYGKQKPSTLYIACSSDGRSYTYMRYEDNGVKCIAVPNGVLCMKDENGNFIDINGDGYIDDAFSLIFNENYSGSNIEGDNVCYLDNMYYLDTINSINQDNYNKLSPKEKTFASDVVSNLAQVKYSNDLAVLINTEGAIDKKGINITWEDVCHEAEEYVPYEKNHPKYENNEAIPYFASEIQLHADGCLPKRNKLERKAYDAKHGTGKYDMAMKNGDLAKSIANGCHAEDRKSTVCDIGDVERKIKMNFLTAQIKYTVERLK